VCHWRPLIRFKQSCKNIRRNSENGKGRPFLCGVGKSIAKLLWGSLGVIFDFGTLQNHVGLGNAISFQKVL